jgi:hypothetical protein
VSEPKTQIRKAVRSILDELCSSSLMEQQEPSVGDWYLFQEFAYRVLNKIGYKGDYGDIVLAVREQLEKVDGWHFED